MPDFLYGTAWKKDRTAELTLTALRAGFRAIDTACQPKHYHEPGVGEALRTFLKESNGSREEIFLQTKFTPLDGHDDRVPYDARADVETQVFQSFAVSCENLGVSRVDSYVLHGPYTPHGLCDDDWAAWRAMERLYAEGKAAVLGISNVRLEQLRLLVAHANTPPRFVQNRCFAAMGWDREIRHFCKDHGIVYQGFSLLTANLEILRSPAVRELAVRHGKTIPQIVFRFCAQIGILPITGTTDASHMKEDLASNGFDLSDDELRRLGA